MFGVGGGGWGGVVGEGGGGGRVNERGGRKGRERWGTERNG